MQKRSKIILFRCFLLSILVIVYSHSGYADDRSVKVGQEPSIIVEDNVIYQNNRVGLRVRGNSLVLIKNSSVYKNGRSGIFLEHQADVKIVESTIFQNEKGGVASNNISRLEIYDSRIFQQKKGGIRVRKNKMARSKVSNVALKNNKIYLNGMGGIHCVPIDGSRVELSVVNNDIYRNQRGGMRIENNTKMTIAGNRIFENNTAGIATYETEQSPELEIYQNKIFFNTGAGIHLYSGASGPIGISNNWIYNNHLAGISLGLWDDPEYQELDVEILNNVIVSNGSAEVGAGIRNESSGSVLIRNNIIAYNFRTGLSSETCRGASYNLLYANGETSDFDEDAEDAFFIERFQYGGCNGRRRGDVLADPLFVAPDQYNFALKDDSPARGAGFQPILSFENKDIGTTVIPGPIILDAGVDKRPDEHEL